MTAEVGTKNSPTCRVCGQPMHLLDEAERRWYCYKDDQMYFAKGNVWNPRWDGIKQKWDLSPAYEPESKSRPFYRRENLVSKQVYNLGGRLVGIVKDVGCSQDGQTTLLVDRQIPGLGGREAWVAFSDVAAIGEIVLVKKDAVVAEGDGTLVY